MALPWHIPLECTPMFKEKPKEPEPSLLKHYCKMNIKDNPIDDLKTGLMCDIVSANRDSDAIKRLIAAGMTIARVVLRDITPDDFSQLIQSIRQGVFKYSTELEYVYPLAILVEIKGPDIITGNLKGPKKVVEVMQNQTMRLTNDINWLNSGNSECVYVNCDYLTEVTPGDYVFIDSFTPRNIKLVVCDVGEDSVECEVIYGGIFGAKMPVRFVNIPQETGYSSKVKVRADDEEALCDYKKEPSFETIEEQIACAIASDVDCFLVPNVQICDDIRRIKKFLIHKGKHIFLFACIESALGVDNIDKIIDETDGIFFDRNMLSTDLPVERVFIAQKLIVSKCNLIGKPCICKAVLNEQIPTLCVTDIANLILDGADVLSLEMHYNTPLKKWSSSIFDPLKMAEQCLAAASVICRQAERIIWQPTIFNNKELIQSLLEEPTKAICVSAVELAIRSRAAVIICLTMSGRTAMILSQVRPSCPIVAVTRECHTARQLRFWRGIRAMHYFELPKSDYLLEVESRIHAGLDYCKAKNILRCGDPYVILTTSQKGLDDCDSVRLLYASNRNTTFV